jgi:hypothetical protein
VKAALLIVLGLVAPALARAAEVTVVLEPARTPALVAAIARVPAELTAAGFALSADCAPALDPGCTQAWPRGARAVAGVAFAWATDGLAIEARVARADRHTVRLETLVTGGSAPEPSVVAVRTAELVRAGVLAVLREPEVTARAPALGLSLTVGPALVESVSGLGGAVGLSLAAALTWRQAWYAGVWGLPTLASSAITVEGTARIRHDLLGVELGRRWRPTPVIRASIGAGGGVYHLTVRGQDDVAPLVPASDSLWTPFLAAGGGVGVALGPGWALLLEGRAAFTRTAGLVRVGASEAGRSGRPLLVAVLAISYAP